MAKRRAVRHIEDDTPIMPIVVADSVVREVESCFGPIGGHKLADTLADQADRIYTHNKTFHKKMHARGNHGRDVLYSFMRHWLASRLRKTNRRIFDKLPSSFANGESLTCPIRRRR